MNAQEMRKLWRNKRNFKDYKIYIETYIQEKDLQL